MALDSIRSIFTAATPPDQMGETFSFSGSGQRNFFERLWGDGGFDRTDFGDLWNERRFWEGRDALLGRAENRGEELTEEERELAEIEEQEAAAENHEETLNIQDTLALALESLEPNFRAQLQDGMTGLLNEPMPHGDGTVNFDDLAEDPDAYFSEFRERLGAEDRAAFDEVFEALPHELDGEDEEYVYEPSHNAIAFMAMAIGAGEAGRIHSYLAARGNDSTLAAVRGDRDGDNDYNRFRRAMQEQMMLNTINDLNQNIAYYAEQIEFTDELILDAERIEFLENRNMEIDARLGELNDQDAALEDELAVVEEDIADVDAAIETNAVITVVADEELERARGALGRAEEAAMDARTRFINRTGLTVMPDGTIMRSGPHGDFPVDPSQLGDRARTQYERIIEADAERLRAERIMAEADQRVTEARQQGEELRAQKAELETRRDEIIAQRETIAAEQATLEAEKAANLEEMANLEQSIIDRIRDNPDMMAAVEAAGVDLNNNEEVLGFLRDHREELSAEMQADINQLDGLENTISSQDTSITEHETTLASLDSDLATLEEQLEGINISLESARELWNSAKDIAMSTYNSAANLFSRFMSNTDAEQIEELTTRLDELEAQEQEARAQAEAAAETVEAIRDEYDGMYEINEDGIRVPAADRFGIAHPMLNENTLIMMEGEALREQREAEEALAAIEAEQAELQGELAAVTGEPAPETETELTPDETVTATATEETSIARTALSAAASVISTPLTQGLATVFSNVVELANGEEAPAPEVAATTPETEPDPNAENDAYATNTTGTTPPAQNMTL